MTLLDTIRADGEQQIADAIARLDKRHRALVLAAVEQFGSVQTVPNVVWREIQQDIEAETAAIILLLLMRSDELTVRQLRRQGLASASSAGSSVSDYATKAAQHAQRMAAQTTQTLRTRLAQTIDGQMPVLKAKDPADALRDIEGAVDDAFGDTRRNTIAVTNTTDAISRGQIDAARRATGGAGQQPGIGGGGVATGGDGAATNTAGQRVRVELQWKTEKDDKVCPICAPLDQQREEVWGLTYPNGPPGHPNCRCSLTPVVVVSASESIRESFDPNQPRGDDGRWIDEGDISAAIGDKGKADELRAKVTNPKEREKLERALGGERKGNPKVAAWAAKRFRDPKQAAAFTAWFGDSKVVDANGEPLVVYHGTANEFNEFKIDDELARDVGFLGRGIYVTKSEGMAASFGPKTMALYLRAERPFDIRTASVDDALELVNASRRSNGLGPLDAAKVDNIKSDWKAITRKEDWIQFEGPPPIKRETFIRQLGDPVKMARSAGFDAVIGASEQAIAFLDNKQIKSATGNKGTFDPTNPDIRESA